MIVIFRLLEKIWFK